MMMMNRPPPKIALPIEKMWTTTLGPPESLTQTAFRLVQPFLHGWLLWQTDRETVHATRSVTIGRIYVRSTAMWPNNDTNDNIYGVTMARPLRGFSWLFGWMQAERQMVVNPQTKPNSTWAVKAGTHYTRVHEPWIRTEQSYTIHTHYRHSLVLLSRQLILILPSHT